MWPFLFCIGEESTRETDTTVEMLLVELEARWVDVYYLLWTEEWSFSQMVIPLLTALPSLAPYERRVIELLRNSKDKRARKLAKKRVSSTPW